MINENVHLSLSREQILITETISYILLDTRTKISFLTFF